MSFATGGKPTLGQTAPEADQPGRGGSYPSHTGKFAEALVQAGDVLVY